MNDKMYIHEFIDVTGHNRARYMHHMTANFSPIAQEERDQLCYGVWGVVGSTAWWPGVVNIWEEDGWDGLASSFRHELGHPSLQDPKLAAWWAAAAEMRSGGVDRLLLPAPWTRTIEELCADGVRGEVYAHERITVPPGDAADFLERVRDQAVPHYGRFGWDLAGAWRTALGDDSECFLLWAVPDYERWAAFEAANDADRAAGGWKTRLRDTARSFQRILLVDAPLSPMRIGRQPARSDRTEDWSE
ncbi:MULTISPECIES: NIPSNAP family protein [Nonomuraea]|uniref:NIPSNAP family protein n=1 Tax=Nonomuraea ferruginea TaxID=46174 RepID=A0ABT4T3L5_9ACTN|nr:NIPSNAP family protein [Nonomuraea ferruginea]MDA0644116.1 NIPSNAP family protein [Nonomuraea ferruginea]